MLSGVRVIFSSDFALELDLSDDGSFVQMFVDRPFLIDGRWVAKFHPCILHMHSFDIFLDRIYGKLQT